MVGLTLDYGLTLTLVQRWGMTSKKLSNPTIIQRWGLTLAQP